MVKQVGLLPAGCQPWNHNVCAASGDRFAYCATLAIYIYELNRKYNEFQLTTIMSEHKKTITSISWSPFNPDLFASSSADNKLVIWDIVRQKAVAKVENTKGLPKAVEWCYFDSETVSYICGAGPLYLWNYVSEVVIAMKEANSFSSNVCVFHWNKKKADTVALGHQDGSISVCTRVGTSKKNVLRPENQDDDESEDPITAIEWDPLSTDYLMIANAFYGLRLIDTVSFSVVMRFQLPSAAAQIHTLSWVHNAPGMFVTGDVATGVLRMWNVSRALPLESIRLKKTGFQALQIVCNKQSKEDEKLPETKSHLSSTSLTHAPTITHSSHFALPPVKIVCTFMDGGVGLYDLKRRKWIFLRDQGHIETIFDCKFKPDNRDLLATASFDGTVKVWDVRTFESVHTSIGNEGVIYSISWAPANLDCLVAGTSKNGMFVWDVNKSKIIKRYMEHGNHSVYTVAWNQKDAKRIMSTGGDGYCVIRLADGKLIQKYKHPAPVFGCDWSVHNKDMLATGCDDAKVRVYYLATSTDQPLKVFSGHKSKVFNVKWSPLKEALICSGSDDGTVRVWDYSQEACLIVLTGHTAPVRGLLWNTEIPYLLISGGWDFSIHIWDVRDGACLDISLDHGADVYGLASHPDRPFLLASCSRDSTVRLWSLTTLVAPVELRVIAQKPWNDILTASESAMNQGLLFQLSGKSSKDLKVYTDCLGADASKKSIALWSKFFSELCELDKLASADVYFCMLHLNVDTAWATGRIYEPIFFKPLGMMSKYHNFEFQVFPMMQLGIQPIQSCMTELPEGALSDKFELVEFRVALLEKQHPNGTENLWELVSVVDGLDDSLLSEGYKKGIMHVKHLYKYKNSEAQELEMSKLSMYGGGIGAPSKEDRLREAAKMHMMLGNLQRYCEVMVELGEWERAVAMAPGVSLSYWKSLASRYAKYLIREDSDDAVPFCVGTGDTEQLVSFYTRRGQLNEAVLISQVANEGFYDDLQKKLSTVSADSGIYNGYSSGNDNSQVQNSCRHLANWYFRNGSPTLAACCHLAFNDSKGALSKLIRGNELELAVCVSKVLPDVSEMATVAAEYLGRRCESLGQWDLAIDILQSVDNNELLLVKTCARCASNMDEINAFHRKAGFPDMEECLIEGDKLKTKRDVMSSVKYFLLSTQPSLGIEFGMDCVKRILRKENWTASEVFPLLQLMSSVRTDKFQQHKCDIMRYELLCVCNYVGALVAMRRCHDVIVPALFTQAEAILKTEKLDEIPFAASDVVNDRNAWLACNDSEYISNIGSKTPENKQIYEKLLKRAGKETWAVELGPDSVSQSHLPSHSDVHVSFLTGQRIQGQPFFLEDGKSAVSVNEALMWAKVNSFSPLNSGVRINPF